MKDPERMMKGKKYKYIFEDTIFEGRTRVNWITDCLLGDIRTFLDGIEYFIIQNKREPVGKRLRGGGNLSVPILINTALEFVAALYAGKTEAIEKDKKPVFSINRTFEKKFDDNKLVSEDLKRIFEEKGYQLSMNAKYKFSKKNNVWVCKIVDNEDIYYFKEGGIPNLLNVLIDKYNATENAKKFIMRYFPEEYRGIPLLLWDGIRNGLVHTFSPKPFKYEGRYIRFQFYVDDQNFPSHLEKDTTTIQISVNVFELYLILEKAVEAYLTELENSTALQNKFIRAWSSIEGYKRIITSDQKEKSKEAGVLFSYLDSNSSKLLLKDLNDQLSVDVLKIYSLKIRRS